MEMFVLVFQDNCGTFDRLIPLLKKDVAFLTIDFPGHGYSCHLPSGMFYHSTVYFLCVNYLVRYFKWDSVYLMGHSLGGITALSYSMFYPNYTDFLICVDGSKPMAPQRVVDVTKELQKFAKYESLRQSDDEPPSYAWDEIKQRVAQSGSIDIDCSPFIARRNVTESNKFPGKYFFTRDSRLKLFPNVYWEKNQLVEHGQNMKFPMFIMKALSGSNEPKEKFYEVMDTIANINKDFHLCKLEGTHHLHLNNPEELSKLINQFLEKYHKVDRSKGGIRK